MFLSFCQITVGHISLTPIKGLLSSIGYRITTLSSSASKVTGLQVHAATRPLRLRSCRRFCEITVVYPSVCQSAIYEFFLIAVHYFMVDNRVTVTVNWYLIAPFSNSASKVTGLQVHAATLLLRVGSCRRSCEITVVCLSLCLSFKSFS